MCGMGVVDEQVDVAGRSHKAVRVPACQLGPFRMTIRPGPGGRDPRQEAGTGRTSAAASVFSAVSAAGIVFPV